MRDGEQHRIRDRAYKRLCVRCQSCIGSEQTGNFVQLSLLWAFGVWTLVSRLGLRFPNNCRRMAEVSVSRSSWQSLM